MLQVSVESATAYADNIFADFFLFLWMAHFLRLVAATDIFGVYFIWLRYVFKKNIKNK